MNRDLSIFTLPLPLGEQLTRLPLPLGRGRVSQSTALRCRSAIRVQANGRGAERGWGEGCHGKVYQFFGDELNTLIEQLNESFAA